MKQGREREKWEGERKERGRERRDDKKTEKKMESKLGSGVTHLYSQHLGRQR